MLKYFEVSGFKGFQNNISIDFSGAKEYQYNQDCVREGLINKSIIYGKNGIGKTNLGLAIFDIVSHLSFRGIGISEKQMYSRYLNANNHKEPAEFRYIFQFGNDEVEYIYKKSNVTDVLYEKLLLNRIPLMEYDNAEKVIDIKHLFEEILKRRMFEDMPTSFFSGFPKSILNTIIKISGVDNDHPIAKMFDFVDRMLFVHLNNSLIGCSDNANDYEKMFIDKPELLNELIKHLNNAGIDTKLKPIQGVDQESHLFFDYEIPLPFLQAASNGTKAFYNFLYWYYAARNASFVFLDEFDAYYHFELAKYVVDLVKERYNTQAVFTTHNTSLMSNSLLRPDCYFVMTENKITPLPDATDRELREGHNLEKLYKSGEFDGE